MCMRARVHPVAQWCSGESIWLFFWLRLYPWYTCLQWPNGVQGKRFWLHFGIPGDRCLQLPNGFAEELFCCILATTVSLRQVPPVSQLCSRESILVAFFVRVCVCVCVCVCVVFACVGPQKPNTHFHSATDYNVSSHQ